MAINFPDNPYNGQVYVFDNITYTFDSNKNYWRTGDVSKSIANTINTYDAGINSIIFSGVWEPESNNEVHTFLTMGG